MKWSFRIGRLAGIDLRVHTTFFLLLAWVALTPLLAGQGAAAATRGALFLLAVFGIVVLHELGHALAARYFGIATRDITLLPLGGVARLERMPDQPRQELAIALAGPAVNVVLAIGLYAILKASGSPPTLEAQSLLAGPFLVRMFWLNVSLAVFNLLPAFPLDGGRVLRALLTLRLERVTATWIAARVGQAFAVLFGLLGLLGNPMLLLIAVFVGLGAEQEARATQTEGALHGLRVGDATVTDFRSLPADQPLSVAAAQALSGFQKDFPVVDRGRLVGVLSRADLFQALAELGEYAPVAAAVQREVTPTETSEPLAHALGKLSQCECDALPVTHQGLLVGILTPESIGASLALRGLRQSTVS